MLADKLIELEVVETVSRETVRTTLKKMGLSPDVRERTKAGLTAARARGKVGAGRRGCPRRPSTRPSSPRSCIRNAI